jgi:2-methylisocitrate lyase-like PEP mutase family enzyme
MTNRDLAAAFRRLHRPQDGAILVLPNAWDALSARVIEHAGARAVATTSAGVSWALGRPDGQAVSRADMIEAVRRIVRTVRVPVTADVESGYGTGAPEEVEETVHAVVDAGAVGINLEDAPGRAGEPLLSPQEHQARLAAARAAGGPDLFINARVDVYLRQVGPESGRLDETINILAGPGAPTVEELARLGVARVSVGPAIAGAAMARIRDAARELLTAGTYGALANGVPFAEANALFSSE